MEQTDALTGLPGRVALDKELAQYFDTREPFAIALLDVDGFQEINDTLGFAEGDGALRRLGALLTDANAGLVHRISGDEFALVMPQVTLEQAFLAAENLRTLVAGSDFALADGRSVKITAGVAHSPRDAKEAQALLNAAERGDGAKIVLLSVGRPAKTENVGRALKAARVVFTPRGAHRLPAKA